MRAYHVFIPENKVISDRQVSKILRENPQRFNATDFFFLGYYKSLKEAQHVVNSIKIIRESFKKQCPDMKFHVLPNLNISGDYIGGFICRQESEFSHTIDMLKKWEKED